jgi:hypothetical protein
LAGTVEIAHAGISGGNRSDEGRAAVFPDIEGERFFEGGAGSGSGSLAELKMGNDFVNGGPFFGGRGGEERPGCGKLTETGMAECKVVNNQQTIVAGRPRGIRRQKA